MFKVFGGFWRKIMFGFMKSIWDVTKKLIWNKVYFLEQALEDFDLDDVRKEEPLGGNKNCKEEEVSQYTYQQSIYVDSEADIPFLGF